MTFREEVAISKKLKYSIAWSSQKIQRICLDVKKLQNKQWWPFRERKRNLLLLNKELKIFHMSTWNSQKFQRIFICGEIHKLFQAYTITLNIWSSQPCRQGCINFVLRARRILCGGLEQFFLPTKEVIRIW